MVSKIAPLTTPVPIIAPVPIPAAVPTSPGPAKRAAAAAGITVPTALAIKSMGAIDMPFNAAPTCSAKPPSSASFIRRAISSLSALDCADNKLSKKSSTPRRFSATGLSAPKASVIARTP